MLRGAVTSVSFRKLSTGEVIAAAARAGLSGIEWGGDVHCPPGSAQAARALAAATADAGLTVCSYGSYYFAGQSGPDDFAGVLDSALALGAPTVRVWAGRRGSAQADEAYRRRVTGDLERICKLAADEGVTVATEWHGDTLTDAADSARRLLDEVAGLRTYWQTVVGMAPEACLAELESILPRLVNLHVYHWRGMTRLPLSEGAQAWGRYLDAARRTGRDHWAILEFVAHDDPDQLVRDAATLIELLGE